MKKIFLFVAALCCSAGMWAEVDFSAVCSSGQTLYYIITDEANKLCITAPGDDMEAYGATIEGDVVIPATVVNPNNSETYTVEGIGGYSFYKCERITSITLPTVNTFTKIGVGTAELSADRTFENTDFTEFVIPDNVTFLGGDQMFRDAALSSITFGNGVTSIPEEIFFGCKSLKRVVFPNNVTTFDYGLFDSSNIKYVELGNNVTSLKANTFGSKRYSWSYSNIDTIVIKTVVPPTVNADGNIETFYGELASRCIVWVPEEAVSAYKAADGWKDFRHILANGDPLTLYDLRIESYSNYDIHAATITLDGVSYGLYTQNINFKRAEGEEFTVQVTVGNPYYGIQSATFGGVDVTAEFAGDNEATLTAGNKKDTLRIYYEQKIHPYDFTEEVASGQTLYFKIIDAVNHKVAICNQTGGRSISGNVSVSYDGNTTSPSGALVIPASITHEAVEYSIEEIDTLAFHECSITSVTFPEGIKAIRAGAFNIDYGATLGSGVELIIPESCKRIEYNAFRGCQYNALNPGGAEVIENQAFLNNPLTEIKSTSALIELHMNICKSSALTKVGLGENVEFVSSHAFSNCPNLATVTCLATTPPVVKYQTDGDEANSWEGFSPESATLYVPKSEGHTVLEAYKAANCWKLFGTIAEIPDTPTALDNTEAAAKAVKRIVNGQLLIERDGKTFNAQGVEIK